jgi:hypothetical protein
MNKTKGSELEFANIGILECRVCLEKAYIKDSVQAKV